jgi:hypothetical protein
MVFDHANLNGRLEMSIASESRGRVEDAECNVLRPFTIQNIALELH